MTGRLAEQGPRQSTPDAPALGTTPEARPETTAGPAPIVAAAATGQALPRPLAKRMSQAAPAPVPKMPPPAPLPILPAPQEAPRAAPVAPPAMPPAPGPRRKVSTFPALRAVCCQLALVLALLSFGRPWPVTTVLLLAAIGLGTVTIVWVRGRWLSEELGLRLRLALRSKNRDLPEQDPAAALLRLLAPGAQVHPAELAGSAAGVVSRAEELVAVLRPLECPPEAIANIALAGGLLPEDDPALPTVRLRLVLHRSPRRPGLRAEPPRAWLAICATRDSDFPGDDELTVSLNNAVRRIRRKLRGSGMDAVPLSDVELSDTLTSLAHVGSGGRNVIREQWRYWRTGPVSQTGLGMFELGSAPSAARAQFVQRLMAVPGPGVATTVALTCAADPEAVLRVASTADIVVDTAAAELARVASMSGVRLVRLDGRHGHGAAATLPIGGTTQ